MNEFYSKVFVCVIGVIVVLLLAGAGSCTTQSAIYAGSEELLQSRISAAVRAERDRWTTELSQNLTDGLREIDERVGRVGGAVEQLRVAVGEYRGLFLRTINSLQSGENEESGVDNEAGGGVIGGRFIGD